MVIAEVPLPLDLAAPRYPYLVVDSIEQNRGRDLNPRPHGPEPCRCRVLMCPIDSRVVLASTESTRLVSFGDPLEPSGAENA